MNTHRMLRTLLAAAVVVAGGWLAGSAGAQVIVEQSTIDTHVGATAIGFEAGLPLVVGLELSHRISPSWRLGVGFGRISGLTAVRAEAQWMLRREARGRFVPSLVGGAEQYFLEDEGREATPVGLHAAFGLDYYLEESPVSLGARFGVLRTVGSSDSDDVKVFAIRNDRTTAMFNAGARYHF